VKVCRKMSHLYPIETRHRLETSERCRFFLIEVHRGATGRGCIVRFEDGITKLRMRPALQRATRSPTLRPFRKNIANHAAQVPQQISDVVGFDVVRDAWRRPRDERMS